MKNATYFQIFWGGNIYYIKKENNKVNVAQYWKLVSLDKGNTKILVLVLQLLFKFKFFLNTFFPNSKPQKQAVPSI